PPPENHRRAVKQKRKQARFDPLPRLCAHAPFAQSRDEQRREDRSGDGPVQRSLALQQRHDSPEQERANQNRERAKDEAVKIKKQNAERFSRPRGFYGRAPKVPDQ